MGTPFGGFGVALEIVLGQLGSIVEKFITNL